MPDIVTKPEGDVYNTTDEIMCKVLLMCGFYALSVLPDKLDGRLVYTFSIKDVWPTVEKILTNQADDMTFRFIDLWNANITWQMNLRHLSQTRKR